MKALFWNDPDPIEGNDYKVSSLEWVQGEVYRITYNDLRYKIENPSNLFSEAEVFIHELEIRDE